jgi:hypothetical protein
VAGTQIGREIDRARALITNAFDPRSRRAMRECAEHELGVAKGGILGCYHDDVPFANLDVLAPALVCGSERETQPGMPSD